MTVNELIEKLKEMPQNAMVLLFSGESIEEVILGKHNTVRII